MGFPLAIGESWIGDTAAKWTEQSAGWDGAKRVDSDTDPLNPRRVKFEKQADGTTLITLTVLKGDSAKPGSTSPNFNERAQLVSPPLFTRGGTYTFNKGKQRIVSIDPIPFLPPTADGVDPWLETMQIAYGKPFAGSPAFRFITFDKGASWGLRRADGPASWKTPTVPGEWWNWQGGMKLHETAGSFWAGLWRKPDASDYKFATPTGGWNSPTEPTIIPSMKDGPWSFYLDAYQKAGSARKSVVQFVPPVITRAA